MATQYLTKSDFVLAHACPTSLYYKKLKYPSTQEEDEYMHHLARGGFMVGKLATLLHPGGILVDGQFDQAAAAEATAKELAKKNAVLFEPCFISEGNLVRVDVLVKQGNVVKLIEVKSKSFETTSDLKKQEKMLKELGDYILDVAYQYFVVTEAYAQFKVKPYLYLPDKAKRTRVEGLNLLFRLVESAATGKTTVLFDEAHLNEVLNDDLLTLVDVEREVLALQDKIKEEAKVFVASLKGSIKKIVVPVSKDCFGCQFSAVDEKHPQSGYDECFHEFPAVEHHIKDLYHIGTVGGYKTPLANRMLEKKKVSLFDIPLEELGGKRGIRQKVQIEHTKSNSEWASPDLSTKLNAWQYPLRFIDFETSIAALPFHKGMRPYEPVAFQWSCHTILGPGSEPQHAEWINLEPRFPNFRFAEALMDHVGTKGTFLMWTTHENTILRAILEQCALYNNNNPTLRKWLEKVVKLDSEDSGMFVDMNKLTLDNYFHPLMKGKTSIKWTLPAVLSSVRSERTRRWLEEFEEGISLYRADGNGGLVNPYALLPPLQVFEKAESVHDGTGAMQAYDDLMFGVHRGDETTVREYTQALLRYCKLDTLAMVTVWEHWRSM